jgi:anti-sigma regulatory factor (Ser/Thr protein kinase)
MTAASLPAAVRVFPGQAEQVPHARRWARALALATSPAAADEAELITAELVANAILHTTSGAEGGTVTVAVTTDGVIHVHDLGLAGGLPCPGLPGPRQPLDGRLPESGQGLLIVAALSTGCVHLPAALCPAAGSSGISEQGGGCCTRCHPAAWLPRQATCAERAS